FVAVGIVALGGWVRHRDPISARLACALGLLAACAFLGEINGLRIHPSPVVGLLSELSLLGSGTALLSLRTLFVPAGPEARRAAGIVVECVALLAIPLLYASFAPPRWLRRAWREGEEHAYERATEALMLFSPDRATVARRGLEWAMRLVGAQAGAVIAVDGEV